MIVGGVQTRAPSLLKTDILPRYFWGYKETGKEEREIEENQFFVIEI